MERLFRGSDGLVVERVPRGWNRPRAVGAILWLSRERSVMPCAPIPVSFRRTLRDGGFAAAGLVGMVFMIVTLR